MKTATTTTTANQPTKTHIFKNAARQIAPLYFYVVLF